jgi:hypothetical protein
MKNNHKFAVLFILKLLAAGFFISAIASFITTIIYNANNNENVEDTIIYIFANLGVTLFSRIVMAVFFFAFAVFIEDWLKTE